MINLGLNDNKDLLQILNDYRFLISFEIHAPSQLSYDIICFVVDENDKLLSDGHVVDKQQRVLPNALVRYSDGNHIRVHDFVFNLAKIYDDVGHFDFCLSVSGIGTVHDIEKIILKVVNQDKTVLISEVNGQDMGLDKTSKICRITYLDNLLDLRLDIRGFGRSLRADLINLYHAGLDNLNEENGLHDDVSKQSDRQSKKDINRPTINQIRNGDFKPINPEGLMPKHGELVYYHQANVKLVREYFIDDESDEVDRFEGEIYITSHRFVFRSEDNPMDIKINNLMDIYEKEGRLRILLSKGNEIFELENVNLIIEYVKFISRLLSRQAEFMNPHANPRKIPQSIRSSVWIRDGGKCVECNAISHLEFDHIIPYSKGGSNSEKNVQLLCRSCNAKKGAKI